MAEVRGSGPITASFCILSGETPSTSALIEKVPFHGFEIEFLKKSLLQAGIHPDDVRFLNVHNWPEDRIVDELNSMKDLRVLIPVCPKTLTITTGQTSLEKYHLSPLTTVSDLHYCNKAVPTFSPRRVVKEYRLQLYVIKAFMRAKEGAQYPGCWKRKSKKFLLNPSFDETMDVLYELRACDVLANDIETGAGIINTVGFAWTESDAIAIQVLPEKLGDKKFHQLWSAIAHLLESEQKKIFQNNIFEALFYSSYGIRLNSIWHDTMWAQRLLYPEFEIGLDNVGRFYTNEVYWKDTGKDHKAEGGKRDWARIKDWPKHLEYNCLDTTGTYEAAMKQRQDIEEAGYTEFFDQYMMKLAPPIVEMCSRGLPVNEETRQKLESETAERIKELTGELSKEINPKSWKQKLTLLKDKGYTIPKIRVKGEFQESTNELSLKKLRLKHPADRDIEILLKLTHLNKALGSYISFSYHEDGRLRFMLNGAGTETLRFSSSKDPWDHGLNAQTLPSKYKCLFDAPPGQQWVQVDLKQAESRFVAYDSCDMDLIRMLEDPNEDVHKFVASHIFEKPQDQINKQERQLGKKSGHGANYDMRGTTFMESCLKEMDLVLGRAEAKRILDTYHRLFPGIRKWHSEIRDLLYRRRRLTNPFGYTRHFYGRMNEDTFREAYAFKPQSTIPMITNHLMLYLLEQRQCGKLDFDLHLQVHDSLVMLAPDSAVPSIIKECHNLAGWHPEIQLGAGRLRIPTEVEVGTNLGQLKEIQP